MIFILKILIINVRIYHHCLKLKHSQQNWRSCL